MSMQTEAEIQESHQQRERLNVRLYGSSKKPNGTAKVIPLALDLRLGAGNEPLDTDIGAAFPARQPQTEGISGGTPQGAASTVSGPTGDTGVQGGGGDGGGGGGTADATGPTGNTGPTSTQPCSSASLDFLDDFFGSDKRHLVAIKKPSSKGWQTDHDHVTGHIRGALCFRCNTGLGHFDDSQERLYEAILYLRRP
jgi:hypothetical protein